MKKSSEYKEILTISKQRQEQIIMKNQSNKRALLKQLQYLNNELLSLGTSLSSIHKKKTIQNELETIKQKIFVIDTNQEMSDLLEQAEKALTLLNDTTQNKFSDTKLSQRKIKTKTKKKKQSTKNRILDSLLIQRRKRKYFPEFEVNTNQTRKIIQNFKKKINMPCKTNITSIRNCEFCNASLMYDNQLKQSICSSCYSIQQNSNIDNNIVSANSSCYKREMYFIDLILSQTAEICNVSDKEIEEIKRFLKDQNLNTDKYSIDLAIKKLKQNKNSKYKIGILYRLLDQPFPYQYSTKNFYFAIDLFNIYNQQFDLLVASQIIKERVNFPYTYCHYHILKIILSFEQHKKKKFILQFFYNLLEIQRKESEILDLWKTIQKNCKTTIDNYLNQII